MSFTSRHDSEIDQLAAPADDGGVLVWPSADRIIAMLEENARMRSARVLRLAGGASAWPGPLPIITGHQPEMMHPGVWIKLVAAARLARRTGRKALFVCVDHDLTNGILLNLPSRQDGRWRAKSVPLGSPGLHTFEQERPRSADEWARLLNDPAIGHVDSAWPVFRDSFLSGGSDKSPKDYIDRWSRGIHALMTACGEAPIPMVRVSEMFLPNAPPTDDRSYPFVATVLQSAGPFAESYNRALRDYRSHRGIRGEAHPIPDLAIKGERTELPFWISTGDGPRARLYVTPEVGGSISIFADASPVCTIESRRLYMEPFEALSTALGAWRIRPRALVLTMYLRLFHCDLFIHGIGGAKYDIITDSIIRDFFGVEPQGYACVTATARLAFGDSPSADAVDGVAGARNRLRTARFNPQRLIPLSGATGDVATALAEREASIKEARNLRETAPNDHAARRNAFHRIRHANQQIASLCPKLVVDAERDMAAALLAADDRVVTQSREWFTGLYSLNQLRALCARLPW